MLKEAVKINEDNFQDIDDEIKDTYSKRRALIFFANRSKLESLRFFIV